MGSDKYRRQVSVLVPAGILSAFDEMIRPESRSSAVSRLMQKELDSVADEGEESCS